jgi:hypothetical protein
MIVQDAPKREARIRRKCGLEGTHGSGESPMDGEEQDEEGRGLLSRGGDESDAVEMCERDIDEALAHEEKKEREEWGEDVERVHDELDDTA